ncbi:CG11943 [Drosophila busckii]|uniref:CG11943 n=1 Tax=Drosophila busckii TaxID=30019 RepID=A0A0M4EU35_DROBS|nr:nuclear pore complex protein Nup205 [Drosophila busckii]ALC49201.1 CG11943 [Drosophila busckii]
MDGVVEDMWTPYKRLYSIFQLALSSPSDVTTDLELCLKKYKQNFTNFLRNPPKNEKSRTQLRNALSEGVMLTALSRKVELSQELIDEAFIVSDMFDLDEIFALELLCTAQRQQVHHPGLPRGLVAVLLYYDGRKAITCTLRDMLQTVSGVAWSTELPRELTSLINNYAQNLVIDSNVLGRLLELLVEMDADKEIALLTKNRAFGSKKHQNQVMALYEDTRRGIAMSLFNWSAQRGLPKAIALRLLQVLGQIKPLEATGDFDDVSIIMLMALLYAYDTSVLLIADCESPHIGQLPILSDPDFATQFYDALQAQSWQSPQLAAIVKYSFGLTLASLRQAPSEYQRNAGATINRDELLIDEALTANIFGIFYRQIFRKDIVYSTEFIYRRLHLLITDFIDFMHAKVSELRGRADETSRTILSFQGEGLEPPGNLDENFELLMLCVSKLYGDARVTITLCNEYWGPTDAANSVGNSSRAISLFKFIRLASDLLPQTLFKPYLKMIAGLTRSDTAARCAFNLLKSTQQVSKTYAVSWDHFFNALNNYFNNMRNDFDTSLSMTGDTLYRSHAVSRNITPSETEHLEAVMVMIQAVAEHDEISRIIICEHAQWQTPQVMLGLIACATPVLLKGEMLFALAALGKSKDTARNIWHHLEESQIIPTLPPAATTSTRAGGGIYGEFSLAEEIVQNESRLERYKLSRGILRLLHTLMTTHMPRSLGAGTREPGYDPYLKFVLDSIMLKFYNRAYKDPSEKWDVGASCLKLLYYLLAIYRPKTADFLEQRDEQPHPGYHIMLHLQVKSDMMRLILRIIEEARERLDDYNQFHGKALLEECALYALLLLEVALAKQNAFFEAHSSGNCSIMLTGLNRMLLDLNPRTHSPDYVINITKFVTYNSWLPRHALAAIKILSAVTMLPNVVTQILNMHAQASHEKLEIRQGFVECLELDERRAQQLDVEFDEDFGQDSSDSELRVDMKLLSDRKPARIELQIKEAIVELFQQNLSQPLPNFVYYLMGIDVVRDFMSTVQQLGIEMNCSCINSLVLLLERHLEQQRSNDEYCEHTAHIVERIYHLFHGLCQNRRTSETILRYFRLSCNDFLVRHLSAMPFREHQQDSVLHAMSHVQHCVAIEIALAAKYGQTTRYHLLCDVLLLGGAAETQRDGYTGPPKVDGDLLTPPARNYSVYMHEKSLLVNRLLDCLTLETDTHVLPQLEFFDAQLIRQLLQDCEGNDAGSASMVNVLKLHDILHDELRHVQSTIASGQRKPITDEITLLLQYATQLNAVRKQRYATYIFMESWCQLVQVLFSVMPETVLPTAMRKQHIIDITEKLLLKVDPMQPLIKISVQVMETVLLLLANLRHCYYQLEDQRGLDEHDLPTPNGLEASQQQHAGQLGQLNGNSCNSSNLRFLLKRLIDWIMTSEVKSQRLSINLYAALLNCLRIVKRVRTAEQLEYNETLSMRSERCSVAFGTLPAPGDDLHQREMAAEMIGAIGEKLIATIAHDAINGHDVCRMLALSCMDLISELRAISTFSEYITSHGYIKHMLNNVSRSDDALCDILKPAPDNLRALYMYESHMAFLTQLSQTRLGARLLLNENVLGVLSNMHVYKMQPDLKGSELMICDSNDFLPDIEERFRSILLPALSLCDSMIASLGRENNSATLQVLNFLFAHIDMIEGMLRAATPFMDLGHLKLLAAITNLLARVTTHDVLVMEDGLNGNQDPDMRSRLCRLQQLMIVVFGRFTVNQATIKKMLSQEPQQQHIQTEKLTEKQQAQHVKYFLKIAASLSLYCRNAVTSHVRDGMTSKYLLTSMISDVTPLTGKTTSKKLTVIMQTILNQLKGSIAFYLSQKSIADNLLQQRASLPNITFGPSGKQNFLDLSQRHNEKREELMQAVFIAEQNLYLLWIHLDFYFRSAVIYSQENRNGINESLIDPANMSVLNASQDEITALKQLLISTFNETFCSQLTAASEESAIKCKNFNAALLRRIKALVQFAPQA